MLFQIKKKNILKMNDNYTVSNDSQNGNWSVQTCVFCNTFLDEKSKILKCLHIVCQKCLPKTSNDSGNLILCLYDI